MYFNDIHVLCYLLIGLFGCFVGEILGLLNERLVRHERIIAKGSLKKFKIEFEMHYGLMTLMFIFYVAILYVCGIEKTWHSVIQLGSYLILAPMLLSAFVIDLKEQIIPNRLVLSMFELGLITLILDAVTNPVTGTSFALNRLEGMLAGGGIFFLITILGGLLMGKEAMGMGDVKLMGTLGLFFGLKNIIAIAVCSFLIGAIISIGLLIFKRSKTKEYIPFGPFIVTATTILMLTPEGLLFSLLWVVFSGEWFLNLINR